MTTTVGLTARARLPLVVAAVAGLIAHAGHAGRGGFSGCRQADAGEPVVASADRLPAPPAGAAAEVVEAMRLAEAAIPAAAADRTRPAWHLRPPALWMNDICGAIHHDGWYHVFYQFNPTSPLPGWSPGQTSAWGHARSRDLVTWEHLPIAIAAVASTGELRCNSGCVVLDDKGTPTIFYTYVPKPGYLPPPDLGWRHGDRQQMIATSRDGLMTWQRSVNNPVVDRRRAAIPESFDRYLGWSDPFVFRAGGETFVTFKACGGLVCRASAPDFTAWSHAGRLSVAVDDDAASPAASEAGEPECPNLARIGDRWLLIESGGGGVQQVRYRSGNLDPQSMRFGVAAEGIVDHAYGPRWPAEATRGFYGTSLMRAPDGRTVIFGWAGGYRPGRAWNSCMGLPREASLDDAGRLLQQPARELERLRTKHRGARAVVVGADPHPLDGLGNLVELDLEVADAAKAAFVIELPAAVPTQTKTTISVTPAALGLGAATAALPAPAGKRRVRVFIDRTLVEIFVDGRTVITQEVPCVAEEGRIAIVAAEKPVRIDRLDAWSLAPIWREEPSRPTEPAQVP